MGYSSVGKEEKKKNQYENTLVYGKGQVRQIVGIEVHNNSTVEIFIQHDDGSVSSVFRESRFWFLSNKNVDGTYARLKGDLHFQWGKQCQYHNEFQRQLGIARSRSEVFSIYNTKEATMVKDGYCYYQGLKQKDVSVMSFDIETTTLSPLDPAAKVLLISTCFRNSKGEMVNKLFAYDEYKSFAEMIDAFNKYIQEKNPSLLAGHNILTFDIPYMRTLAEREKMDLFWGRDGSAVSFSRFQSKFRLDGTRNLEYNKVSVYGREIVDTYFLTVAYDVSKSFETYALKSIVKHLGFEKQDRQHYDASQIRYKYTDKDEWEKIKQYCIDDAEDPIKLWDHMGPLFFNMAPMIPKPFTEIILSASGSKINSLLLRAYLQQGHSIPKASDVEKYQGAISFGVPGIYKNCFKIDLASLYPSIMLEYSVYDKEKDPYGYVLELVKIFRENRLEYKKKANETGDSYWREMDTTSKGILNSFYGFFGAPGLHFNSFKCASFITSKGREILEYTIKWASGKEAKDFIKDENKDSNIVDED